MSSAMCPCTRIRCLRIFWRTMAGSARALTMPRFWRSSGALFWYTVEFGLIRQGGEIKVYGSGLISSHGECTNVMDGHCAVRRFHAG